MLAINITFYYDCLKCLYSVYISWITSQNIMTAADLWKSNFQSRSQIQKHKVSHRWFAFPFLWQWVITATVIFLHLFRCRKSCSLWNDRRLISSFCLFKSGHSLKMWTKCPSAWMTPCFSELAKPKNSWKIFGMFSSLVPRNTLPQKEYL